MFHRIFTPLQAISYNNLAMSVCLCVRCPPCNSITTGLISNLSTVLESSRHVRKEKYWLKKIRSKKNFEKFWVEVLCQFFEKIWVNFFGQFWTCMLSTRPKAEIYCGRRPSRAKPEIRANAAGGGGFASYYEL